MIRCLLVDDEPLALDLLEDNVHRAPDLRVVSRCRNAYEALEILQRERIDLIFLDIQMPGMTGLKFLEGLKNPPMVILVTAYNQFALEGFRLDVIDYLVKPVSPERFQRAVQKSVELFKLRKMKTESGLAPGPEFLYVNAGYTQVKIVVDDITHIEGLKDYIKIHICTAPKPVVTRMTLKAIEGKLPGKKFIRVHKSYIVSMTKLISIRNNRIKLQDAEIPVSDFYRENVIKHIESNSVNRGGMIKW
ncbi:MAG: LytR/AlgR family response regulator transcription factor [Bacteroidia bacterium]